MKTTNLKWIAYAFSALILMQSCVVYHKAPVSVAEAVATNGRVKIYTTENKKYKFSKLTEEDGNIYGFSSLYGANKERFAPHVKEIYKDRSQVKILLPFEIKEVYSKDNKNSTWATIGVILAPIVILVLVGYNDLNRNLFSK